ncbi:hypothetical protein NDU88_009588, partial [Pleurodeles waltl]
NWTLGKVGLETRNRSRSGPEVGTQNYEFRNRLGSLHTVESSWTHSSVSVSHSAEG